MAATIAPMTTTTPPPPVATSGDWKTGPPSGTVHQILYVNGTAFSNPLYFKTSLVGFLAAWPLAFMCYTIYFYNICNYKNFRVTAKMLFFPLLMLPGIIDNIYDLATEAKVSEYDNTTLIAMIITMALFAVISLVYLSLYCLESIKAKSRQLYEPLATDEDEDSLSPAGRGRWWRIIDEYMVANSIWGLTTYNMMLTLIYVARYVTHNDYNLVRESDVAIVSLVLLGFLIIVAIMDFLLFRHPCNGCVFMQYAIGAVFALNFTVDFQAQVDFCEILTLAVFFVAVFLTIYKFFIYVQLGVPAGKKQD